MYAVDEPFFQGDRSTLTSPFQPVAQSTSLFVSKTPLTTTLRDSLRNNQSLPLATLQRSIRSLHLHHPSYNSLPNPFNSRRRPTLALSGRPQSTSTFLFKLFVISEHKVPFNPILRLRDNLSRSLIFKQLSTLPLGAGPQSPGHVPPRLIIYHFRALSLDISLQPESYISL